MNGSGLRNRPAAGRLRHHLAIQVATRGAADEFGGSAEVWVTIAADVPADITVLDGFELWRARQVHAETSVQVVMRYDSRIDTKIRFVLDGSRYLYPLNCIPDPLSQWMTCLCKERPDG